MAALFPIYLSLKNKDCLVVGGGKVAQRKVQSLIAAEASVRVISPKITSDLLKLVHEGKIFWKQKKFHAEDLENPFIVISATDDENVNKEVATLCMEKNIPVNVVDDPPKCTFHIPAVVRRGDFALAISTAGKSPMLAGKLRRQLEFQFGEEYEIYVQLLGEMRERILKEIPEENKRRKIFKRLVDSDLLDLIKEGKQSKIKERIEECMYS
ncbi:MAG: precorrin-2 dehydrogenase [Clostridia bacterium]|jgi:precorrin-2 dehydrogenase/sirohydrochlorin ferrochelatase|nr:precorrin-2 dehydrogenase [Clostridia bacterium]